MKKIFFSAASLLLLAGSANAQYDNYAALFGRQTSFGGTARYAAIGGAGTALGGDLGAATVNPAGLGMYRKSEFSFSPNFGSGGSNTTFLDNTDHDNKGSFSISSLGIAICGAKDDLDKSDWRGGTFSLGMSRTNNFHNRVSFSGVDDANTKSSIADNFVQNANGIAEQDLANYPLPYLAYSTYLINPIVPGGNQYTNYLDSLGGFGSMAKEGTYTTKGGQYQWNIAYGANYKDKFYIGGGLGITSINFKEDLTYTETHDYSNVPGGSTASFDVLTFNDNNQVKGTGVNFKLGYIYKVNDILRLGTTVTTPTYYWMNQQYSSDLTVSYPSYVLDENGNPLGTKSQSTDPGYFKFNYTTPVKLAVGASIFAGKSGFISADMEYIPYQLSDLSGRNNADNKFLKQYNRIITNSYQNVLNLRLGGELRVDIFKLRAGLAYLPNPYKSSDDVNRDVAQISGGAGVKLNDFYIDLGIVNTRYESSYQPYSLNSDYNIGPAPIAVSKNSLMNVILTMGFYFE
jgi:hypothetical protein